MNKEQKRPIDIGTKLYISTDINECAEENNILHNVIRNKEGLKRDWVRNRQVIDGEIPEDCDRYFIVEIIGEIKLDVRPSIKKIK